LVDIFGEILYNKDIAREVKFVDRNCKTIGTVIAVKKLWWLKVNTKPVRSHSLDGALFPHTITVKYTVKGIEYIKKAYVPVKREVPLKGAQAAVYYNGNKPSKCRIEIREGKL